MPVLSKQKKEVPDGGCAGPRDVGKVAAPIEVLTSVSFKYALS